MCLALKVNVIVNKSRNRQLEYRALSRPILQVNIYRRFISIGVFKVFLNETNNELS